MGILPLMNLAKLMLVSAVVAALAGCGTLSNDLIQAENAYEEAKYDEAEVWLADIDSGVAKLDTEHRARFYYMRGMTAYRLGRRNDALHYLVLAREEAGNSQASHISAEKRQIMERTLVELTPHTATHRANETPEAGESNEASETGETGQAAEAGETGQAAEAADGDGVPTTDSDW
jgi:hypothetical protein